MEPLYDARLSLSVETDDRGTWALPKDANVGMGRLPGLGLAIEEDWVPSRLCRFMPYELGWLVQLGRARGRISNKYLGDVVFNGRTVVALQPGRTRMSFPELDDIVNVLVVIGAGEGTGLPVARDAHDLSTRDRSGTVFVGAELSFTPGQREVLAVAFEHLMHEESRVATPAHGLARGSAPTNIAAHAASRLGKSEQAVKNVITKTRDKLNRERWLNLQTTEQLGQYLVRLTGIITPADLP